MKTTKKIFLAIFGILVVCVLGACQKTTSPSTTSAQPTDWLVGKWQSDDWDVTYTITESDDKWTIETENSVLAKEAKLSVEDNVYTLQDEKGTQYVIEQVSETEILYRQLAVEGQAGTSETVSFKKLD
ncbi:hypothetical protein ACVR1I_10010 [Streptococcus cameli]